MFKKIIAAIAIAGCLALAAPQAAGAGVRQPADGTSLDEGGDLAQRG